MSWLITGSEKTPVDPVFNNVSLLLHGNGTNGSTTITDSSPTPKTVTAVGNAQISTAQSKPGFGGASIAFDGTGDYATVPSASDFNFGTADFTVELWVYRNNSDNVTLFSIAQAGTNNGFGFQFVSNQLLALIGTGSTVDAVCRTPVMGTLSWIHVALVRLNGVFTFYSNGIGGVTSTATLLNAAQPVTIGAGYGLSGGFIFSPNGLNGYIDDLRITKGIARYTANFTPPTAPFPDI